MSSQHVVTLIIGDWSNDGHGRTTTRQIRSNLSKTEIEKAYKIGTKLTGIDIDDDVACDYEEPFMSREQFNAFEKAGIPHSEWNIEDESFDEEDRIRMSEDSFSMLYCLIVRLGNPQFKFEFIPEHEVQSVTIGGYGLFYG